MYIYLQSGKLALKMFIMIKEYIEDPQTLLCVLIVEVGGFPFAQQSALTDTVQSVSVRVVNFLLSQVDQIRS
jgi:hypothetical protein